MEQKYLEMVSGYSNYFLVVYALGILTMLSSWILPKYIVADNRNQMDVSLALTAFSIGLNVSLFIAALMM